MLQSNVNPNLEYFGYYHGATYWGDYMAEFGDHSNVVMVSSQPSKLDDAQNHGMKALVEMSLKFFYQTSTVCRTIEGSPIYKYALRKESDYVARWESYVRGVVGREASILGFYLMDEPYWHCLPLNALETAAGLIKATFPDKKIMVTFAHPMVDNNLVIPQNLDWISFDKYGGWTSEDFEGGPGIPDLFNTIKSKLNPGQKIILTADGVAFGDVPSPGDQQKLVERARKFYSLAQSETDVVGILAFLWPNVDSSEQLKGLRSMPVVQDEYSRLGGYITGRNSWCKEEITSQGKPTSAKNSSLAAPHTNAVDGNLSTAWNAGNLPPQWIQIDLQREMTVSRIRLCVSQSPAGNTTHEIWTANKSHVFQKVATISGPTCDGQVLEGLFIPMLESVQYVKIQTTSSPSWVGWNEIQVFSPKLGTLVSQGKPTSASAYMPGAEPSRAVNGILTESGWNAGDFPPQWIEVDLGASTKVSSVKLYVNQSKGGNTTHEIWITNPYGSSTCVWTFSSDTIDGQILEKRFWPVLYDVRRVKIKTVASPSWVSWDEVQVFKADKP